MLIGIRRSHINGVSRLVKPVVRGYIGFHGLVCFAIFSGYQLPNVCLTCAIDLVLVIALHLMRRVTEHFSVIGLLCDLGHRKTVIKHVLVVLDEGCITTELVIESVLCVRQNVSLVSSRCRMGGVPVGLGALIVLPQVRVEGSISVGRAVVSSQST